MRIEITVDPRNAIALMRAAPQVLKAALDSGCRNLGAAIIAGHATKRFSGRPGLIKRTRQLSGSAFAEVVRSEPGLRVLVAGFAGVKYAGVQEFGKTIVPVRKRWLTIPTGPALTAAGNLRGSASTIPGLRFIKTKNPLLAMLAKSQGKPAKGEKEKFTVYFWLKKRVIIPPRLGFGDHWKDAFRSGRAGKFLGEEIGRQAKRLNGGARAAN